MLVVLRRGTEAEWNEANPVLFQDEPGVTTDTGGMKVGNGQTPWTDLKWTIEPGGSPPPSWMLFGFNLSVVKGRRFW